MKQKSRLLPNFIDSTDFLPSYQLDYNNLKQDPIVKLSHKNWNFKNEKTAKYSQKTVHNIFFDNILNFKNYIEIIATLDYTQYFEKYLIPHFDSSVDDVHIISVIFLINEKCRNSHNDNDYLEPLKDDIFSILFKRVVNIFSNGIQSMTHNKTKYGFSEGSESLSFIHAELIQWLIHMYQKLSIKFIRVELMKLISIGIYKNINENTVNQVLLKKHENGVKLWNQFNSKLDQLGDEEKDQSFRDIQLIVKLMNLTVQYLSNFPTVKSGEELNVDQLAQKRFCERNIQLLIDLLSILPTRRFLLNLIEDYHFILKLQMTSLLQQPPNSINQHLVELLNRLKLYCQLEVDENTGVALSPNQIQDAHYQRLSQLQLIAFKNFKVPLEEFYLTNIAKIDAKDPFISHMNKLTDNELIQLCELVHIRTRSDDEDTSSEHFDRSFLLEALALKYQRPINPIEMLHTTPLYPTEVTLFDPKLLQAQLYNGAQTISIPKLGSQFLSLFDYFYRNFFLYQYESLYSIWQDIEDVLRRLNPTYVSTRGGSTEFMGWARMGIKVEGMQIVKVSKPRLGETVPSEVVAEITIDLSKLNERHQKEWLSLKPFDTLFLVLLDAKNNTAEENETSELPYSIKYIRGCEVVQLVGPEGKNVDPYQTQSLNNIFPTQDGRYLSVRIHLDPNQYFEDSKQIQQNLMTDIYTNFNLLIRRNPRENQFKSVLETIRDLIDAGDTSVPDWLKGGLLGYDDPRSLHYSYLLQDESEQIDFRDTFLDVNHLKESFLGDQFLIQSDEDLNELQPPFRLEFVAKSNKRKKSSKSSNQTVVNVSTYKLLNMGPYDKSQPKLNSIRFTPTQVEAIRSGCNPGLTMVVGPPGTGKTDVAVQIISNLYHNHSDERILLVTHSNHALNRLFEKIKSLNIDDNHLLRLGHGTDELLGGAQFGKYGRLDSFLEKRLSLLSEADKLVTSLGLHGANHADTCETSIYFFEQHVFSAWGDYIENLENLMQSDDDNDSLIRSHIVSKFPFANFFQDAPQPLFKDEASVDQLKEVAEGCYRHLKTLYDDLFALRPLELLRNSYDRANYLLTNRARIVAMTCTHAALKRQELIRLGFKYSTVVMEEAGQILEIETAIPLLLQTSSNMLDDDQTTNQVRRVVLLGDHAQLPPIVKGLAFQKFGNMEQSMFDRLIQLGTEKIVLDRQGRARAALADVYRTRYPSLQDLPSVLESPEYLAGNAGFTYPFQIVNVGDYQGKGEAQPQPYFYQNLGEAEYMVSVYQYMRLLGYPSDKITMLTTYAGQKALIQDVLEKRCGWNDFFKPYPVVATVDGYQGEQNDYILLSLVRTNRVGYIRDLRRWTTALSRARLGLYVFCRPELFTGVPELSPSLSLLQANQPDGQLNLTLEERHPTERSVDGTVETTKSVRDVVEMGKIVYDMIDKGDFMQDDEVINPEDLVDTNFDE